MQDYSLSPAQNQSLSPAPEHFSFPDFRKRFHQLVMPHVPALVLDGEGTVRHLTEAARHLLKYATGRPFDPCFFSHVHGRNLRQVMHDVADMVRYGKTQTSWLLRLRTGQGHWRWFKATAACQPDASEKAIVVYLRDLYDW